MSSVNRSAQLAALLAVSRRVAETEDIEGTLDLIAYEASEAVGAHGATIMLIAGQGRLRLGGAWGLRDRLRARFDEHGFELTESGPTSLALASGKQIVIPDLRKHPDFPEWTRLASSDMTGALTSNPLAAGGELIGTLNVYRQAPGPWGVRDLELLSFLADHAASALRIAHLIERQNRQLVGFDRVLRNLREQTHEHANRVHSISALIAMGEAEEAKRFITDQLEGQARSHESVVTGIAPVALAGLLLAEIMIARQSGIDLEVDGTSRLSVLPGHLSEAESVALVGQLLDYSFEAVRSAPAGRRRVVFGAQSGPRGATFCVADWGAKASSAGHVRRPHGDRELWSLTRSSLVEMVTSANGTINFESHDHGTIAVVRLPA